jgi:hypothetical protein
MWSLSRNPVRFAFWGWEVGEHSKAELILVAENIILHEHSRVWPGKCSQFVRRELRKELFLQGEHHALTCVEKWQLIKAQRDEILFLILTGVAAKLLMVDFEICHGTA